MNNKYEQALHHLAKTTIAKNSQDSVDTLQKLIDICSQPNSIKLKLDHIQDVIDSCYETDTKGKKRENRWNSDVDDANEYLQDIEMAYSFRVEDTRIVNELQELLGCSTDNIVKRVKQLDKALDKACEELVEYTEQRCECHCGGGCYNVDKNDCDNDCFFKGVQTKEQWKEYLIEESREICLVENQKK